MRWRWGAIWHFGRITWDMCCYLVLSYLSWTLLEQFVMGWDGIDIPHDIFKLVRLFRLRQRQTTEFWTHSRVTEQWTMVASEVTRSFITLYLLPREFCIEDNIASSSVKWKKKLGHHSGHSFPPPVQCMMVNNAWLVITNFHNAWKDNKSHCTFRQSYNGDLTVKSSVPTTYQQKAGNKTEIIDVKDSEL